jgi:hypothetical protein
MGLMTINSINLGLPNTNSYQKHLRKDIQLPRRSVVLVSTVLWRSWVWTNFGSIQLCVNNDGVNLKCTRILMAWWNISSEWAQDCVNLSWRLSTFISLWRLEDSRRPSCDSAMCQIWPCRLYSTNDETGAKEVCIFLLVSINFSGPEFE